MAVAWSSRRTLTIFEEGSLNPSRSPARVHARFLAVFPATPASAYLWSTSLKPQRVINRAATATRAVWARNAHFSSILRACVDALALRMFWQATKHVYYDARWCFGSQRSRLGHDFALSQRRCSERVNPY